MKKFVNSGQFKKGQVSHNKGKKGLYQNPLKGKKMPEEWKKNLMKPKSVSYKGEDSNNWKGGVVKMHKRNWLKQTYGLTIEDFDKIFISQDGRCAICGAYQIENAKGYEMLCVDHNHSTGTVRGLLCRKCNAGIGQLKDNIHLLENAISYLKKHEI